MGRQEADKIVFYQQRLSGRKISVPIVGSLVEPMRRALHGKSGTIIAADYRGEIVLAAYEPVIIGKQNFGIVAKVDISEIREPHI